MHRTGKKSIHISSLAKKKKKSVLGKHIPNEKHYGRIPNNLI